MTPHDLIAAFSVLAEAPEGVARLRELVLQLAVSGKLVPQDPNDEPASALLERVATQKAQHVRAGRLHRTGALLPISQEDTPFEAPENWVWSRLAALVPWDLVDGDWVESKDQDASGTVRLTQLADVGVDRFLGRSERFLTVATASRLNCTYLEAGDILISRLPRPLGRACIFPGLSQPAVTVVDVAIARCSSGLIFNRFLVHLINSPLVRRQMESRAAGTTRQRVSTGNLRQLSVPVPPLAEQHRIVARVDELMGLLDRLEAARNAREATRTALRDAALAALRDADTPAEVEAAWRRIAERMDDLFAEPTDVEPLRQAILQLAVRGRLVPQDPHDEPASVLLERIAVEKGRLVKEGRIRASKASPPVSTDDAPFHVPQGWAWCRLQDIGDWGAGATPRRGTTRYYGGPFNWFKSGELPDGPILGPSEEQITQAALDDCSLRENQPGDVLIAMYGATIGRLGLLQLPGTTNQAVCACTCHDGFYNRYLFVFLAAWRKEFVGRSEGGAQPNISKEKIVATPVPVPPLAEQHRIVARVDELVGLLDRLAGQLADQRQTHDAFAAAAAHHLDA